MRCREIEPILESGVERTPEVREHLGTCHRCAALARDWARLRTGFAALASEQGPEPSWGFAERVKRRLGDASEQGQRWEEFLERAGRRVVFATLVVTLMALLGLTVPSSGPLRAASHPTVLFAQQESTADYQEPMLGVGATETIQPETAGLAADESAGEHQQR